tara:strand:+ start:1413 stop:2312 length:900 start_codon:yes stop_codon:yes gene_type:complete
MIQIPSKDKKLSSAWKLRENNINNIKRNSYKELDKLLNNNIHNVPRSFWAYHAGMTDGDGCIARAKNGQISYKLQLCDLEPISELAEFYDVLVKKCVFKNPNWNDSFEVTIHGYKAIHFFKMIAPYMKEKKLETINIIRSKEPRYNPCKINLTDCINWLSGYMDAEGTFKVKQRYDKTRKKYYPLCAVGFFSTNKRIIDYVENLLKFLLKNDDAIKIYPSIKNRKKIKYNLLISYQDVQLKLGEILKPNMRLKRKIIHINKLNNMCIVKMKFKKKFGTIDFNNPEHLKQYNNKEWRIHE